MKASENSRRQIALSDSDHTIISGTSPAVSAKWLQSSSLWLV
jgi:hypothetical protein